MDLQEKYFTGLCIASFDEHPHKDQTIVEETREAFIGKRPLIIDMHNPNLHIANEFNWGSFSRGTKQLAVSMLLEIGTSEDASSFSDTLVRECLSLIPAKSNFKLQEWKLREWLKTKKSYPDEATDLMLWVVIEEKPHIRRSASEQKPSQIIPPPPLPSSSDNVISKSTERRLTIQQGGTLQKTHYTKYPLNQLEVGKLFYCINPTPLEKKKIFGATVNHASRYNQTFIKRVVTAEWARAHNIKVAQDNAQVLIVLRTS